VIAGQTPFSGKHPVTTTEGETGKTDGAARSDGQETPFAKEKLIHVFDAATGTCRQDACPGIEFHLAHAGDIHDKAIVVQTKSFE
jgi:hypothetical protein